MSAPKAYFQPDNRNIIIVENCSDMQAAEKQADDFLDNITSMDEAGSHYQRIKVSGTWHEGKCYFDVVVVA